MPGEQELLDEVLRNPDDEGARLIYADWLEERGDRRAEYLRLEILLSGDAAGSREYRKAQDQLRRVRARLDATWVAVVARTAIENCQARRLQFDFECPLTWESLTLTKESHVRFCDACRETVLYCPTLGEARRAAAAGRCVAVDSSIERREGDLTSRRRLLGKLRPPTRCT